MTPVQRNKTSQIANRVHQARDGLESNSIYDTYHVFMYMYTYVYVHTFMHMYVYIYIQDSNILYSINIQIFIFASLECARGKTCFSMEI